MDDEPIYRAFGKQVKLRDLHFADAATDEAAKRIADAMNRVETREQLCHPLCILSG